MGVKFKNQMNKKTNISRISRFSGLSCIWTNSELEFELPKILVDLVDLAQFLELFKRSQTNHDPRTKNNYFMNNEQATSDRVQAKNSQAKRGTFN
jgi:hypothetical protein